MPISFKCPQCGKAYKNLSDEYAGKKTKCKCGKVLILGAAKPAPTQPAAPQAAAPPTVQPTVVQPTNAQPEPVQPIPVQPVPIQPVAPMPVHQAQPAGDPLFGAPPQSGGSVGDLLGTGAPANDPLGGFHGGYAPPAPVAPQPARQRSRRRSSKNPTGPILSIIGGVAALIFGVTFAIISIMQLTKAIDGWSTLSNLGALAGNTAGLGSVKSLLVVIIVTRIFTALATIAMAAAGGYSLVLGILELTNNYRKSIASQLALTASALYALVLLISKITILVMVTSKLSGLGGIRGRSFSLSAAMRLERRFSMDFYF